MISFDNNKYLKTSQKGELIRTVKKILKLIETLKLHLIYLSRIKKL